jgi:hypothetical protein
MNAAPDALERWIVEMVERTPTRSVAPEEIARALAGAHFEDLVPAVCAAALRLESRGLLHWVQDRRRVDPYTVVGAFRFSVPTRDAS